MSIFAKHSFNMFAENAFRSACFSCGANNTFCTHDFVIDTDTVFAVSVLLYAFFSFILLALLGLIGILFFAGAVLINFLCLITFKNIKAKLKNL